MAKKDNIIGLGFNIDTVDLKTGIKSIKSSLNQANKDFQSATAGLDKWSASTEGLEAKLTQLSTKLDGQKKTVTLYEKEIERVSKMEGDHSAELANLKTKLQDAEIAVKKTEKEIRKYSSSLEDVSKKEKEEQSTLNKLSKAISEQEKSLEGLQKEYKDAVLTYGKNSKEAKNLKKEISNLSDELEDNKKQVQFADKQLELLDDQLDDTADSAEKLSKGFDGIKGIGATVGKGVAAVGAGIAGLATAFLSTASESKEFRTNMGKLETGFETSGLKAEQATETYKNLFAVVADEGKATEATAMLGQLASSQEELNTWTNILTGVYATFGDSLPIEGLAEAALETSKTGQLTGSLADALNWVGKSEEEFQASLDACTTEQERQKLITDTLNGVYDEASQKYQQVNKDVIDSNKAQVELSDTMAQLGEKAEPILTTVKEGFNTILQEVLKLTEGVDFNALAEKIKEGFAYFIDTIIPAIKDGFQWILDNKDTLIAAIVAIGTGMLAWNVVSIVQGLVGAIKAWTVATEGMTIAQKLLNLAMNANPIGIVITVITSLVAAFVTLWNTSDGFRNFWIGLWDGIKNIVKTAVDWIKENWDTFVAFLINPFAGLFKYLYDNFEGFRNTVDSVMSKVVQFFKDCWENIKSAWSGVSTWFSDTATKVSDAFKSIPSKIKEFFSNAWTNVKNAWSNIGSFFNDAKDTVINKFKELPEKMLTVGEDLVKGLWNGIKDMTSWITEKLKDFTGDVLGGIKKFFGIHSPSKKMAEIGKDLNRGLAKGIKDNTKLVTNEADKMGKKVVKSVKEAAAEASKVKINIALTGEEAENKYSNMSYEELSSHISTELYPKARELGIEAEKYNTDETLTTREIEEASSILNASYNAILEFYYAADKLLSLAQEKVDQLEAKAEEAYNEYSSFEAERLAKLDELWDEQNKYSEFTPEHDAAHDKYLEYSIESSRILNELGNASSIAARNLKTDAPDIDDITQMLNNAKDMKRAVEALYNNLNLQVEGKTQALNAYTEAINDFNALGPETWGEEMANKMISGVNSLVYETLSKVSEKILGITNDLASIYDQFLENQKDALDAELEHFNEVKDNEIEKQRELYEQGKISLSEYEAFEEQVEKDREKREEEVRKKKDAIAKKQFIAEKANAIAQATINGALATVKVFKDYSFPASIAVAALQGVKTAAEIATIAGQTYVPMLAKGGIVSSPTLAMVGEAGKEAVMPLENNTGWIEDLAKKISGFMQKNISISSPSLALAGAASGPTVVNYYYNQTLNSPTQLSRREIYRDSKNLLALKGI